MEAKRRACSSMVEQVTHILEEPRFILAFPRSDTFMSADLLPASFYFLLHVRST